MDMKIIHLTSDISFCCEDLQPKQESVWFVDGKIVTVSVVEFQAIEKRILVNISIIINEHSMDDLDNYENGGYDIIGDK